MKQIFCGYDIVIGMNKMLPVVEHTLSVYKMWYGYRDHFPKKARYTLGDKIDARFLSVLELVSIATYQEPSEKISTLTRAITGVDLLKFLLRVVWEIRILDAEKYAKLSEGIQEIGRQLGGWKKGLQKKTPGI